MQPHIILNHFSCVHKKFGSGVFLFITITFDLKENAFHFEYVLMLREEKITKFNCGGIYQKLKENITQSLVCYLCRGLELSFLLSNYESV